MTNAASLLKKYASEVFAGVVAPWCRRRHFMPSGLLGWILIQVDNQSNPLFRLPFSCLPPQKITFIKSL